jgi:PKD repeat protein
LNIINSGAAASDFALSELPGTPIAQSRPVETAGTPAVITIGDNSFTSNPRPATGVSNQGILPPRRVNSTTITESVSQSIISGNSVSCNNGVGHTDNDYLRVFDLAAFGIDTNFSISSVDIGIELASGATGSQPAEIRLYTLNGPLLWANMTLIASAPVTVPDQSLTIINMPVAGTIPAGSQLVVDFFTPDGTGVGNLLFVGSNNLGQTAPTYLAAADCGVAEPTDTAAIGFPDMHLVMNVTGDVGSSDVPWLSELPVSGTVGADSTFDVEVSFDSMTYTLGTYTATLVLKDADPVVSRIDIPVTMHIVAPTAPVVSFTSDSPVNVGNPIVFTNTSDPGEPPATEFVWDFGDGITKTVSTADPVVHLFGTFGTFTVSLTACNVVDCDTVTHQVVVLPKVFYLPFVNKN